MVSGLPGNVDKKLLNLKVGPCNFCGDILTWRTFSKVSSGPYNGYICCPVCKIRVEHIVKENNLATWTPAQFF